MKIDLAPRVVADLNVSFGKPVIAGNQVPIEIVVGKLGGGISMDEVMDDYGLSRKGVVAALTYAQHRPGKRRLLRLMCHFPPKTTTTACS
jgi:uncharacterized protein (DUF433 family)